MRLSRFAGTALTFVLVACAPRTPDRAADTSAVRAAYERYRQAVEAEDLSEVRSVFASPDTAVVFFTGGDGLRGVAAIAGGYQSWFAAVDSIRLAPRDVAVHLAPTGEVAWVDYLEDGSVSVQGEHFEWQSRRATLVWQKYDGEWRMVQAHWSDPAPPDN